MDNTMVPCGLVSLTMVKLAVGPSHAVSAWLHGSAPDPPDPEDACGVNVGILAAGVIPGAVGRPVPNPSGVRVGSGVFVATIVGMGVLVGGNSVALGRDSRV